jgi:hypothetical protein
VKLTWLGTRALLRRHTMMLALGGVPLLVFGAAAVSRPAPAAPPVIAKPVITEGVTMRRMDDSTFRRRWSPIADMPAATQVRYLVSEREVAGTVPEAVEPPPRHRLRTRAVRLDVCARHGQRKVITRGGKSWRCRR